MNSLTASFLRKWTRAIPNLIVHRARTVAGVGFLLAIVGVYFSVLLYMNLKTDILELLPTQSRSVLDLTQVTRRLESIDNLAVLLFSEDPVGSKKFVLDLAQELNKVPKTTIASIEYQIENELRFFKERQALYMDTQDLIYIRDYIHDRIAYETELYNPVNIFSSIDIPEPHFNFLALKKKYESRTSTFDRMPGGFYATPDEKIRVILVNLPGVGTPAQILLRSTTLAAIEKVKSQGPYPKDLSIKLTGGVEDSLEEQDALIEDLELSTVIVTVLVMLGMLYFFRSGRATFALMLSVFMGTAWTFGASYFAVGYLNANSAFLGSIVIGNGINFGIIYLARYLEERRKDHPPIAAALLSIQHTATATWTAALAAGLSYGSLMLTGFRGFKQFGVIGLIGMLLCWISAFTVLPALLILLDQKGALIRHKKTKPIFMNAIAAMIGRFPRLLSGITLILTLVALMTLTRLDKSIIETDLSQLRNQESLTHGSAYLTRYLDEVFQRYLSPTVILPSSRENAARVATQLRIASKNLGEHSPIGLIQTMDDFIPKDQAAKIKVLHEIQHLLPERMVRRLSTADQTKIQFLLNPHAFQQITETDLPPLLISKFTEKDGSVGKLVLVEPPITKPINDGDSLMTYVDLLRQVADEVEPGAAVAGQLAISSDMLRAIAHDGPNATLSAFIAVVTLVIFLFRDFKTIALVLLALFLGVLWLAGIILGFKLKINFLNFIALPITFGIGVDYAVNIFQRYKETQGNILDVIRTTGSAVLLCSYSTIIGYTSLLIASNRGFVSFGRLAVAGEVTCVLAAVVFLPALISLISLKSTKNKAASR